MAVGRPFETVSTALPKSIFGDKISLRILWEVDQDQIDIEKMVYYNYQLEDFGSLPEIARKGTKNSHLTLTSSIIPELFKVSAFPKKLHLVVDKQFFSGIINDDHRMAHMPLVGFFPFYREDVEHLTQVYTVSEFIEKFSEASTDVLLRSMPSFFTFYLDLVRSDLLGEPNGINHLDLVEASLSPLMIDSTLQAAFAYYERKTLDMQDEMLMPTAKLTSYVKFNFNMKPFAPKEVTLWKSEDREKMVKQVVKYLKK
jgi:hypothetical protein